MGTLSFLGIVHGELHKLLFTGVEVLDEFVVVVTVSLGSFVALNV
jgi:hypothetical protein